jgi:4-aminobutyrate aminotransferase-like enzyme
MGKPMGNGHPLAGLVARAELLETFGRSSRYFNTFGGNPVSCAVGMAVLDVLEREQLMENARSVGDYTRAGLRELAGKHELIGDVRGSGLFIGVDLVLDRAAKTPATEAAARIVNGMRERGVLLSRIGPADNVLKIRPPMPFSRDNADLLTGTLNDTLTQL